jgi:hypothetical protein
MAVFLRFFSQFARSRVVTSDASEQAAPCLQWSTALSFSRCSVWNQTATPLLP